MTISSKIPNFLAFSLPAWFHPYIYIFFGNFFFQFESVIFFDIFYVCLILAEPRRFCLYPSSASCHGWGQNYRLSECAICGSHNSTGQGNSTLNIKIQPVPLLYSWSSSLNSGFNQQAGSMCTTPSKGRSWRPKGPWLLLCPPCDVVYALELRCVFKAANVLIVFNTLYNCPPSPHLPPLK